MAQNGCVIKYKEVTMSNNKQSMNWRELFLTTSWNKKGMFKAFTFLTGFFLIMLAVAVIVFNTLLQLNLLKL
jgi:hypothetical protein